MQHDVGTARLNRSGYRSETSIVQGFLICPAGWQMPPSPSAQRLIPVCIGRLLALSTLISILLMIGCGGSGTTSTPPPLTYTVSGLVSGLTSSGLVLQDNGGNNLTVAANATSFTFSTALASGSAYSVTVFTPPSNPSENCVVTNGSGTVAGANVTNVQVTCSALSAQSVAVNWTDVHQIIDGFGAADAQTGHSMSSTNQNFFFGTGNGQLGLSLLRAGVTDGSGDPGSCLTVSTSCAGVYISDMQAIIANGGRVYASPWSPPAACKTNGLIYCTNNSGLSTSDYGSYATWLANYVESLQQEDGITLYALSLQNEPNICQTYDSAVWTAAQIDTFVADNLGPTFSSDNLTTLIFLPEGSGYNEMSLGIACGGDSSCNQYVGGINWHDYDASLSGTNTIAADPYPSPWPAGKKYWETEASCGSGFGPNFCQSGFNTDITDALDWAAVIDQRIAVDGANAWLYWWLIDDNSTDDQGLMASDGTIPERAYMMGQYSKFVRPGYYRIDATHLPGPGVSVSAYHGQSTNTLVIIATNYSNSAVELIFNLSNAPAFSTVTPWTTSVTLSLAQQTNVPVSSNSFTYTLPPSSITTFVGTP
jgi:glucuronoarabinoxylan endo-1,4-beta-xylanase